MSVERIRFSEALNGFAAVKTNLKTAVEALIDYRHEITEIRHTRHDIHSSSAGFYHLCPLADQVVRYLLFQRGEWSFILWNDVTDIPIPDAYAISRVTGCKSVAVAAWEKCRKIEFYSKGRALREIHSQKDGEAWYSYETGSPLPFEDPREEKIRRRTDRLKVDVVKAYYKAFTGHAFPRWAAEMPSDAVGLDLFYTDMIATIQLLPTFMDIREDGTLAEAKPKGPETTESEIVTDKVVLRAVQHEMEIGISRPAWW